MVGEGEGMMMLTWMKKIMTQIVKKNIGEIENYTHEILWWISKNRQSQ